MCGISAILTFDRPTAPQPAVENGSQQAKLEKELTNGQAGGDSRSSTSQYRAVLEQQLEAGLEQIRHRGPDDSSTWVSEDTTIALGHARLSIIDLSPRGKQPLSDAEEAVHAVVNGELYDHERIRAELQAAGHTFKSSSDSEIALALYHEYGLSFLSHLRGEFALCLYDSRTRTLIAARDRYGIKPLFYTVVDGRLLIASEVKAFLGMGWKPEWDVTSLAQSGWVFDSRTIFKGVRKLRPAHYLSSDSTGCITTEQYWDMDYPDHNVPETRSVDTMVDTVRAHLLDSVRLRLRADVPVAVYLSGGIDSSAVAGIANHLVRERHTQIGNSGRSSSLTAEDKVPLRHGPNGADLKSELQDTTESNIDVFTIRFPDAEAFDESLIARRTANFLGARMHTVDVTEADLAERFEDATWHCEHPTADLNFIAKNKLAEETRKAGFKVVLTGEGADEHFAGYSIFEADFLREADRTFLHPEADRQVSEADRLSLFEKREGDALEQVLRERGGIFAAFSTQPISLRDAVVPRRMLNGTSTCRWLVATSELPTDSFLPWTKQIVPTFDRTGTYARAISGIVRDKMVSKWHPLHTAMYTEVKGTFQSILLSSLGDRTEMSHSLEARTPFLDHHLTEYVNSLPPSIKIARGDASTPFVEKWVLREATKPFITPEIYGRKKHPYSAPIQYRPGGPLHKVVSRLLTRENVQRLGWADFDVVQGFVEKGFGGGEVAHIRQAFVFAQLVSLSLRFDIPPASPPVFV